jgi:MOSC domain-containing protein YiiM
MNAQCHSLVVSVPHLYISRGHNFFGHHGREAGMHETIECSEIQCVAGRGIVGDRFFDGKPNHPGQITFFAMETYDAICAALNVEDKSVSVFRRNVITSGVDLNDLIGAEFEIQGLRFRGVEECKPCYWMDRAFAPGAEEFLRGRGGLRAMILMSGGLRRTAVGVHALACACSRQAEA